MDVDFGVVHPLQPSGSLAEVEPGKLAHDTAQRKKTASAALCQREGTYFDAFIVTFGTWDGGALRLTQALVRATALHRSCSLLEAARSCRSRLAAAVLRGMCRQVERGFPEGGDGAAVPSAGAYCI